MQDEALYVLDAGDANQDNLTSGWVVISLVCPFDSVVYLQSAILPALLSYDGWGTAGSGQVRWKAKPDMAQSSMHGLSNRGPTEYMMQVQPR